jgi:hypothetical protein
VGAARRTGSRAQHNRFHFNEFVVDAARRRERHGSCVEHIMLKITIKTHEGGIHIELEGELAGSWVCDWRLR